LNETKWIKLNIWLLFSIIPLSFIGYYFAVNKEPLFPIYEWLVYLIIFASLIVAIVGIVKVNSEIKWVSISILTFHIQFIVLCLFLGPFSFYGMFPAFYITSLLALISYILTINKTKKFRFLMIIFLILTILFLLYMIMLHSFWGNNLSLVLF
jgi:hypothetical protein